MNIGVFLLIKSFQGVEEQLKIAKNMGFSCADISNTNSVSMLGTAGLTYCALMKIL